ncbi:hypothetical protein CVT24_008690 [Panaeolus cyanescens]|uniref:MYND-type domain-containing protein n=1 Tax=Panaeolus cyanescens TaxID=181874 RepID=A0A409VKN6_9AGAR|nr:hypothetical protein CVT24_008690 [Panaeolus cyanescens]
MAKRSSKKRKSTQEQPPPVQDPRPVDVSRRQTNANDSSDVFYTKIQNSNYITHLNLAAKDLYFMGLFVSHAMTQPKMDPHEVLEVLRFMAILWTDGFNIEIAKHSKALVKMMRDFPDDEFIQEHCVNLLSSSNLAVFGGSYKPLYPIIAATIDLAENMDAVIDAAQIPFPDNLSRRVIIAHAVRLVATTGYFLEKDISQYPRFVNFLVAGLRSNSLYIQGICMDGIQRFYKRKAPGEPEHEKTDLGRIRAIILDPKHSFPPKLNDVVTQYGSTKTEAYLATHAFDTFVKYMLECGQQAHHDYYTLGKRIVPLIFLSEFAMNDGLIPNGPSGGLRTQDIGFPFQLWGDVLPRCARAIRMQGDASELVWADILEIHWYCMRGKSAELVRRAREALKTYPDHPYLYQVIMVVAYSEGNMVEAYQAAKKGLGCQQITPFQKYAMMPVAVEVAADLGLYLLRKLDPLGQNSAREVIPAKAFLMGALEDAKAFLDGAPPDNHDRKIVSVYFILLTVLMNDEISMDLHELQDAFQAMELADEFHRFIIGLEPSKTEMSVVERCVTSNLPSAMKEFGDVFAEFDQQPEYVETEGDKLDVSEATLKAFPSLWLDCPMWLSMVDEAREIQQQSKDKASEFELYRCFRCGIMSAMLRRCGACGKARYCDTMCQKQHWSEHKKSCKAGSGQKAA